MNKCLHLVVDDKFIDGLIDIFESVIPKQNLYLVNKNFEDVGLVKDKSRLICKPSESDFHEFITGLLENKQIEYIFLHSLHCGLSMDFLSRLRKSIKVIWIAWGYDLYNIDFIDIEKYAPLTKQFLEAANKKSNLLNCEQIDDSLAGNLREKIKTFWGTRKFKKGIARIDYCATPIPLEFDYISKKKFVAAKKLIFNYGVSDDLFDFDEIENYQEFEEKKDILIGNSATFESNHLDAFSMLKNYSLDNRKLLVPLSYGREDVKSIIVERGNEEFGECFVPLLDFLSLEEYTSRISKCTHGIFYHERQQGLGAIGVLWWIGAKVFMSENSIAYKYFKNEGYKVFSIQKDLNQEELDSVLDKESVIVNRRLLVAEYSRKACKCKALKMMQMIGYDNELLGG